MPNWCSNSIRIRSTDEQSLKLLRAYEDYHTVMCDKNQSYSFMDWFHPTPEDKKQEGWYEWRNSNWGCKWDFNMGDSYLEFDKLEDGNIELTFSADSPWSPPIAFYDWMVNRGFAVEAEYSEEGMGFAGVYKDGNDEEVNMIAPVGVMKLLNAYFASDVVEYGSNQDIEEVLKSAKTGDLIPLGDNSVVYVSHEIIPWSQIEEENEDLINNDLQLRFNEYLKDACEYGCDVTQVKFVKSLSEPGEITGIVIDNKLVCFYED